MNGGRKTVSKLDARVGQMVRRLREDKGWRGEKLASIMGLSQASLCRLERGKQAWTLDTLVPTARALGVRPSALLESVAL